MSRSDVDWQVDLPALSSLVLNLGAAGLKKYAQAGVDIHTLLCMGEIAEVCPACQDYRKDLNRCRQQQRKQSILLYKFVEIGTGSNFVSDELLKNRAGENVVALMSTVLPLLNEENSDMFLSKLFESCNISADKIPGFGQLQVFCDTLLPLARKTAFKDQVYLHSMLLYRLQADKTVALGSSIPNIETLVQLVLLFKRLTQNDSTHVLSYHGWQGAAWVIAYARHVLGLPVCVMRTRQDPVPVSGDYLSSKAFFIHVSEKEPMCELLVKGVLSDWIIPSRQGQVTSAHWMIELGNNVNLRELHLQTRAGLDHVIVGFTRSLTVMFIAQFARDTDRVDSPQFQFRDRERPFSKKKYIDYCLPQIKRRSLKILGTMGFTGDLDINVELDTWHDHLEVRFDQYSVRPATIIVPGRKLLGISLAEESSVPGMCTNHHWFHFSTEGKHVIYFITMIAEMASLLAFSNWDEKLRLVSTKSLETSLKYGTEDRWQYMPVGRSLALPRTNKFKSEWEFGHKYARGLCGDLLNIVTGYVPEKAELANVMALEHQGIVVASAGAGHYSIDFEAVFFNFEAGHISID
ncbi:MAG: hypothetical protein Q9223_007656, partial [Gallowayella weberi]